MRHQERTRCLSRSQSRNLSPIKLWRADWLPECAEHIAQQVVRMFPARPRMSEGIHARSTLSRSPQRAPLHL
eukprot:356248-Pyramimonas_sp.AAC.1